MVLLYHRHFCVFTSTPRQQITSPPLTPGRDRRPKGFSGLQPAAWRGSTAETLSAPNGTGPEFIIFQFRPQHCLYLRPDPHGQGSFRPGRGAALCGIPGKLAATVLASSGRDWCRIVATQLWDQIRRFDVDFINLFFRELAFAGANFLQCHQEDHLATGFFIGPIQKILPRIRSKAHRACVTVYPRLPKNFVSIRIGFVKGFDQEGPSHCLRNGIVMRHDGADCFFSSFLIRKMRITCFAPYLWKPFSRWDHFRACQDAGHITIKLA